MIILINMNMIKFVIQIAQMKQLKVPKAIIINKLMKIKKININ